MIGFLKGRVESKTPDSLLIDVNGVGFLVFITLHTYSRVKPGEEIFLYTHHHLSDGEMSLYGFVDEKEKKAFEMLLRVQGIGPRLARNILSGIPAEEFEKAVAERDTARLMKVPGVGRKLAEKIVFSLKEVIKEEIVKNVDSDVLRNVYSSLVNLGFKSSEADEAVRKLKESGKEMDLETAVKEALKILGSRMTG